MMKIRLPKNLAKRWHKALTDAGSKEIGGVIFAEQLIPGDFRIVDFTLQKIWGGTPTSFRRNGSDARRQVLELHEAFGNEPNRFNYFGEWHSHPNAPPIPSLQDELTMRQLLAEQGDAVNFLVLIIAKLIQQNQLGLEPVAYLSSGQKIACEINVEDFDMPTRAMLKRI